MFPQTGLVLYQLVVVLVDLHVGVEEGEGDQADPLTRSLLLIQERRQPSIHPLLILMMMSSHPQMSQRMTRAVRRK